MRNNEIKKNLGLKIKFFRNKLGYTQEELGEKINRTQRQVSLIEIGTSFPNPETLVNLTKVFNCSMKDLFDFDENNIKNMKKEIHKFIDNTKDDKIKMIYYIIRNLL